MYIMSVFSFQTFVIVVLLQFMYPNVMVGLDCLQHCRLTVYKLFETYSNYYKSSLSFQNPLLALHQLTVAETARLTVEYSVWDLHDFPKVVCLSPPQNIPFVPFCQRFPPSFSYPFPPPTIRYRYNWGTVGKKSQSKTGIGFLSLVGAKQMSMCLNTSSSSSLPSTVAS